MLQVQLLPLPELRTPRLVLRRITAADAPAVLRMRSEPLMMRYLDREPATGLDDALQHIGLIDTNLTDNAGVTWGLARAEAPAELLGTCGIWRLDLYHHRGEVGYALLPEAWGQGLMQEALAEVCRYGFEVLKLHSLEGNVNPLNEASIRVLERLGFVREGYFRENYYFRGQFTDSAIYSLLAPKA